MSRNTKLTIPCTTSRMSGKIGSMKALKIGNSWPKEKPGLHLVPLPGYHSIDREFCFSIAQVWCTTWIHLNSHAPTVQAKLLCATSNYSGKPCLAQSVRSPFRYRVPRQHQVYLRSKRRRTRPQQTMPHSSLPPPELGQTSLTRQL